MSYRWSAASWMADPPATHLDRPTAHSGPRSLRPDAKASGPAAAEPRDGEAGRPHGRRAGEASSVSTSRDLRALARRQAQGPPRPTIRRAMLGGPPATATPRCPISSITLAVPWSHPKHHQRCTNCSVSEMFVKRNLAFRLIWGNHWLSRAAALPGTNGSYRGWSMHSAPDIRRSGRPAVRVLSCTAAWIARGRRLRLRHAAGSLGHLTGHKLPAAYARSRRGRDRQ